MDVTIYIAIIVAIVFRLVIMRGTFVLPTLYRRDNEMSFNLGSISTIIIAIVAAFALMQTRPDLFANWYVAGITAYSAPQITDAIVTSGARNFMSVPENEVEDTSYDEVA